MRKQSFDPVASLVPSGENLQNQTSSEWSVRTSIVTQFNVSLDHGERQRKCWSNSNDVLFFSLWTWMIFEQWDII